jgi:hypothetical protein
VTLAPIERTAISISRIAALTVVASRTVEARPTPGQERTGGGRADVARWTTTIPKYIAAVLRLSRQLTAIDLTHES